MVISKHGIDKIRAKVGAYYKPNKRHRFKLAYAYQRGMASQRNENIIQVGYLYKFKRLDKFFKKKREAKQE